MALRRPLPRLLALLAIAGAAAPALDTTPRDLTRMTQVEFTELFSHPHALSGQELRFRCIIAARTDLYDHLRSAFRPERFYALAVWDDRARLWEPEARADVAVGLFLNKDRFRPSTIESLMKYTVVDVGGVVKEVIDGLPQIEVLEISPVQGAGAVTDQAVYQIERALALQGEARDLAEVHFQEALKVRMPLVQRIDVEVLRARNLLALGDIPAARAVLESVVASVREDTGRPASEKAQIHALLAKALVESQAYEGAVVAAREALALDPSLGEAYAVLGIGLAGLEQYEEARRSCDSAVRLRPADAEVRWYLGRILSLQKRYDEAIETLKRAIDLTPKDHRIHLSIAEAYLGRGLQGGAGAVQDLGTALREVDITLRLKGDLSEAHVLGGRIIEVAAAMNAEVPTQAGRVLATPQLALERYLKALDIAPASPSALAAAGHLYLRMGRTADVQSIIERLSKAGAVAEAAALQVELAQAGAPVSAAPAPAAPAPATPVAPVSAPTPASAPAEPAPVAEPAPAPMVPVAEPVPVVSAPVEAVPAAAVPTDAVPAPADPGAAIPVVDGAAPVAPVVVPVVDTPAAIPAAP